MTTADDWALSRGMLPMCKGNGMDSPTQTVAALLTPLAPGAIAVIGLAGHGVDEILNGILRGRASDRPPDLADRTPTLCRLADGGALLDDVVVVRMGRANVKTAELNIHGGVRLAQRTLLLLESRGATLVDADVFAARFSSEDPIERDVDRALVATTSRRLTRWLLNQRRVLPGFLRQPGSPRPADTRGFQERSRVACRLIAGLRVAIVGPPNAGKSTLANRLIGRDRVITSRQAGTTRDWVSETALIRGWPVTLTDTAGVRPTDCAIEAEAIRRGRQQAESADLILAVLDATTSPAARRDGLTSVLKGIPSERPRVVALNKSDAAAPAAASDSSSAALPISALTGAGIEDLESCIESSLSLDLLTSDLPTAFLPEQLAGCTSSGAADVR